MSKNVTSMHMQERLARKIVRRTTIRGTLLVVISAIFWATSSACGQYLMNSRGVPAEWLASTRILASGFILTLVGVLNNRGAAKELIHRPKDIITIILYGTVGLMMAQFTFLKAVNASNSATATVLQYLGPIMIVIFVCVKNLKMPTVSEAVSIVLAVAGVFLLATHGNPTELAISKDALIFGFLAALGMVFYSVLPVNVAPRYGSITVAGLGMLAGGIVEMCFVRPWTYDVSLDAMGILAWCAVTIIGTALGYTIYAQGVADIGSVKAGTIASIEPVTSTLFTLLMGTSLVFWDFAGIAAIIATIFILSRPSKQIKISFHHPSHGKNKSREPKNEEATVK